MKLITWNINSVRLRIDQVIRLLAEEQPDVLCLQEIKCRDGEFPTAPFRDAGYEHILIAGQKGYHGVATIARRPLERGAEIPFCRKSEARHVAAKLDGIDIHNFYLPAGGDVADRFENEKFDHKLTCYENLTAHFSKQPKGQATIICGDLNTAPFEHDVWNHKYMSKIVSHTPVEVEKMADLRAAYDFTDVARQHVPLDQKLYSWWSYRASDFRESNRGLRLDHVWASPALKDASAKGEHRVRDDVRGWERPSDHAPVSVCLGL